MTESPTDCAREWSEDPRLAGAEVELYREVEGVQLLIYIFKPPADRAGNPSAAIVFLHGGGWNGGDPAQFGEQCKYLAGRGMVALTAEYRVADRQGVTPWECVDDAAAALRWTQENAPRLGIDPARIAAGGGSAGGHLAACVGVCPVRDQSPPPSALVLFNPVLDLADEQRSQRFARREWREASPLENVEKGAPPTIIFHGTADETVPIKQARDFTRAMEAAGNRCELVPAEGGGHGFFNFARRENGFYENMLRAADRFLASLGWLEGEPEI